MRIFRGRKEARRLTIIFVCSVLLYCISNMMFCLRLQSGKFEQRIMFRGVFRAATFYLLKVKLFTDLDSNCSVFILKVQRCVRVRLVLVKWGLLWCDAMGNKSIVCASVRSYTCSFDCLSYLQQCCGGRDKELSFSCGSHTIYKCECFESNSHKDLSCLELYLFLRNWYIFLLGIFKKIKQ